MSTLTPEEVEAIHQAGIDKMLAEGGSWSIVDLAADIEAALRAKWFADAAEFQYRDGGCWFRMPGEHAAERFRAGFEIRVLFEAPQEEK
jgi:hypothetical protein